MKVLIYHGAAALDRRIAPEHCRLELRGERVSEQTYRKKFLGYIFVIAQSNDGRLQISQQLFELRSLFLAFHDSKVQAALELRLELGQVGMQLIVTVKIEVVLLFLSQDCLALVFFDLCLLTQRDELLDLLDRFRLRDVVDQSVEPQQLSVQLARLLVK